MRFNQIFFGLWFFLFALFAYWQINDPDPEVWVSVYGVAMIFCLLGFKGIFPKIPLIVVLIVCLMGAVYFYPGGIGDWVAQELAQKDLTMKTTQMEEARETFGLMIVALVLGVGLYRSFKKTV